MQGSGGRVFKVGGRAQRKVLGMRGTHVFTGCQETQCGCIRVKGEAMSSGRGMGMVQIIGQSEDIDWPLC